MSDKCDARILARQAAGTEREGHLVDELLTRRWVLFDANENNRVGMSGLGWRYWVDFRYRLEDRGFQFVVDIPPGRGRRTYVRMVFPGEAV